jgi:hypothetical protein
MADYLSAWRKYRQLRTQFLLLWAGFLPAMAMLGGISARVFHDERLLFIAIAVWIPLFFFSAFRIQLWRCPRCGEKFGRPGGNLEWFNAKQCVHCGLPRNANPVSAPSS